MSSSCERKRYRNLLAVAKSSLQILSPDSISTHCCTFLFALCISLVSWLKFLYSLQFWDFIILSINSICAMLARLNPLLFLLLLLLLHWSRWNYGKSSHFMHNLHFFRGCLRAHLMGVEIFCLKNMLGFLKFNCKLNFLKNQNLNQIFLKYTLKAKSDKVQKSISKNWNFPLKFK